VLFGAVVGVSLTALSACSGSGSSGSTVTVAVDQEYTSYNNGTYDQITVANGLVLNMTLPGPFAVNADSTVSMWKEMMTSVEVTSADPMVITYTVKPEAVWSDGEPIDCDDFYLSWLSSNGKAGNRKKADGTDELDTDGYPIPVFSAGGTTGYDQVSAVTCDATGRVITATYEKPYADWKALFGGLLPAHVVEEEAGVTDLTATLTPEQTLAVADVWNNAFVGFDKKFALSGAWYKITKFKPGVSLTLEKNDKFWGTPANIDRIVFKLLPESSTHPQALENGDVQVIAPQPSVDVLKQLQGMQGVTVTADQGASFEHYDLNAQNEFLKDLKVRQAFALCLDRQEIVDTLAKPLNDKAEVLNNRMFVPGSPYYENTMGDLATRDIPRAKQLLTEAGFTFDADGIAVRDGKQLTLRLGRRDPNDRRQKTNELAIEQCREAGFVLTDDPSEDFNSVRLDSGDFDVALFAWAATPFLSGNDSIYLPPDDGGDQNYGRWANAATRGIIDRAAVELDEVKRSAIYNELDTVVSEDVGTIPLFQWTEFTAHSNRITGVKFNAVLGFTWNANEWQIVES
jgi:peptide/nickel transport system substrate-binding protein